MKPPCEIVVQYVIPVIRSELAKELLNLFGLSTFELEGYEADDIVGTMAKIGGYYYYVLPELKIE